MPQTYGRQYHIAITLGAWHAVELEVGGQTARLREVVCDARARLGRNVTLNVTLSQILAT